MRPSYTAWLGLAPIWAGLGLALWAVADWLERNSDAARLIFGGTVFGVAVVWMGWLLARLWLAACQALPPERGEP